MKRKSKCLDYREGYSNFECSKICSECKGEAFTIYPLLKRKKFNYITLLRFLEKNVDILKSS